MQNQQPVQFNELTARVYSLERDLQAVKSEVLHLQFENYIDGMHQLLSPPSDCGFVVSEWRETQAALSTFLDDSTRIRGNGADPRIRGRISVLLSQINRTCKTNLVFNHTLEKDEGRIEK